MRILFISRWYPYPADNGARLRLKGLLHGLAKEASIDLITFSEEPIDEYRLQEGYQDCRRIEVVPYSDFNPRSIRSLLGLFSPKPRSVLDTYSDEMKAKIQQALQEEKYNLVVVSERDMIPYCEGIESYPILLEEFELGTLYEAAHAPPNPFAKIRYGLSWRKSSAYFKRNLQVISGCTVVSEREKRLVRNILPAYEPIEVIPNGIELSEYQDLSSSPSQDTIIYVGAMTYKANHDAVDYFASEIFPNVLAERPEVKLIVTGSTNGVDLGTLENHPNIRFSGYLDDIRQAIANSWVSIVPLRIGGGTRLKILESLALGTPIVSTSKGVEGLDFMPKRDFLLADNPVDFAEELLNVLTDEKLRLQLSRAGKRAVKPYAWSVITPKFNRFVRQLASDNGSHQ